MVKRNWFSNNIFNFIWLALIIILLGGTYYAWNNSIIDFKFKNNKASSDDIIQLESATSNECKLEITPTSIDYGDSVTGIIWTKYPNTLCEIFGKLGDGDWLRINEGTTDIDGTLIITEDWFMAGDFTFAALCGDCRTNDAILHVDSEIIIDCTDTDGIDEMVPGHVTHDGLSYYDECAGNWAVIEYFCNEGVDSKLIACDPGYICTATRSGDYCRSTAPTWENGDVVGSGSGSGSSSTSYNIFEIILSDDFNMDGTCGLMATIDAGWTYTNENQNCQGIQGSEGIHWMFYDSDSLEWERIDPNPTYLGASTECVLDWDGQTPFHLEMNKLLNIPECVIDYEYNVRVIVCNCQQ